MKSGTRNSFYLKKNLTQKTIDGFSIVLLAIIVNSLRSVTIVGLSLLIYRLAMYSFFPPTTTNSRHGQYQQAFFFYKNLNNYSKSTQPTTWLSSHRSKVDSNIEFWFKTIFIENTTLNVLIMSISQQTCAFYRITSTIMWMCHRVKSQFQAWMMVKNFRSPM